MIEENIENDKIEGGTHRIILKLKNERLKEEILKKTVNEYKQTIEVVSKLSKKLNHKVIIPFSRIAFYEGNIKYTNNIYQDIGCNTYCERTAENAENFLKKKLNFYEKKYKIVHDSINRLTKEIELALEINQTSNIEKKKDSLNNIFMRPDGFFEIREEYHSSDEETKNKEKSEKEKNFKDNKEINIQNNSENDIENGKNVTNEKTIYNENTLVQEKSIKRCDKEVINFEKSDLKEEKQQLERDKVNLNIKNKFLSNKSLNINEQGLLNVKENYSSSSSYED